MHLTESDLNQASKYSFNNSDQIKNSEKAGCYCCLHIFNACEIEAWTAVDNTAICPFCGVDSVLGDASPYHIELETLTQLKKRWFI